jgi:hypothetical protein
LTEVAGVDTRTFVRRVHAQDDDRDSTGARRVGDLFHHHPVDALASGEMNVLLARVGRFLGQPLVIAILAGAFTAFLLPDVTRQWQDTQSERNLKQSLLEEISTSGTTAVSHGLSLADGHLLAAGGQPAESHGDVYQSLRDTWFTDRADARSRILVYFPNLYTCWYSFDHAVADYLSLGAGDRSASRITALQRYVDTDFATSYVKPAAPDGCKPLGQLPSAVSTRFVYLKGLSVWKALALPGMDKRSTTRFRNAYAVLAEELDIAMERVVYTIVKTHAEGFSHGIFGL